MAGKKNLDDRRCIVCGYRKSLDRVHFIPKFFLPFLEGYEEYAKFNSSNIGLLCKNHHWEYDHFSLKPDELIKVLNYISDIGFSDTFDELLNSVIRFQDGKKYTSNSIKKRSRFIVWMRKMKKSINHAKKVS